MNHEGDVTVNGSTLSGNSAYDGEGGGIFNASSSAMVLNSTLSGNSASTSGGCRPDCC